MLNQWKRFSTIQENVIELRRLCCVDATPKNAESFFISRALKQLKEHWIVSNKEQRVVVSYADKEYFHTGIIYKATNFKMIGEIPGTKVIIYNNRTYHDKTIRTKYKGKLKPFAAKIKKALKEGEAYYKKTAGKYTFVFKLKGYRKINQNRKR